LTGSKRVNPNIRSEVDNSNMCEAEGLQYNGNYNLDLADLLPIIGKLPELPNKNQQTFNKSWIFLEIIGRIWFILNPYKEIQ
jgi:hypothetical protein